MSLSDVYAALSAPFPVDEIKWRVGATNGKKNRDGSWDKEPTTGLPLAYIDARCVMDRLDSVVGPDNWSNKFKETPTGRVICYLTIFGVTKADGAGATDMEGEKGGLSDAFKRAGVHFGIGRYLYRLESDWVPVKARGRSAVISGSPPDLPSWARPASAEVVQITKKKQEPKKESEVDPREKAIEVTSTLFKRGMKEIGGEEFLRRVNNILEHRYLVGEGDTWKSFDIETMRNFYKDVDEMISNVKKEK